MNLHRLSDQQPAELAVAPKVFVSERVDDGCDSGFRLARSFESAGYLHSSLEEADLVVYVPRDWECDAEVESRHCASLMLPYHDRSAPIIAMTPEWKPYKVDAHQEESESLCNRIVNIADAIMRPKARLTLVLSSEVRAFVKEKGWDVLFAEIPKQPEVLRGLTPTGFEEFTAELLIRKGFEVIPTGGPRDQGIDMLAYHPHLLGKMLVAVQCKRYKEGNKVDVKLVRDLYGAMTLRNDANACALFTTSSFTTDASKLAETNATMIYLHDLVAIQRMVLS